MKTLLSAIVMYPATYTAISCSILVVAAVAISSRRNRLIFRAIFALTPLYPTLALRLVLLALVGIIDFINRLPIFKAQHDAAMFLYKVTHDEI